jgi:invasion protein IalB
MRMKKAKTARVRLLSLQRDKRQQACAAMRTPVLHVPVRGTASAAAKTSVASKLAMAALALTVGPHAHASAQQASTNPPVPSAQAAPAETVQMIFSPWTRYCARNSTAQSSKNGANEVCFTAADGHLASGQKLAIALLIGPVGSETKLLRVTLPLGVALVPGARIVIDEKEAMTAPYVACLPKNGCMADYKADADFIEKLKKGRSLAIQAFDKGKPISFTLPLTGFAKAYEGPASDPTGLNDQEGLPNELQGHSDDHRDTPGGK